MKGNVTRPADVKRGKLPRKTSGNPYGALAQLVARDIRIVEVRGSTPLCSTRKPCRSKPARFFRAIFQPIAVCRSCTATLGEFLKGFLLPCKAKFRLFLSGTAPRSPVAPAAPLGPFFRPNRGDLNRVHQTRRICFSVRNLSFPFSLAVYIASSIISSGIASVKTGDSGETGRPFRFSGTLIPLETGHPM